MVLKLIISFLLIFGYLILLFGIILMVLSIFNFIKTRKYKLNIVYEPSISLMVPAYNEGKIIERTIQKFIGTDYPKEKKEMVVINDGSTDDTEYIVTKYAGKIINLKNKSVVNSPDKHFNIILINRDGGGKGKSFALNDGKLYASGELLFFIDADIQLDKDTFKKAASHFFDESVDVLTGYVRVNKNGGIWNKFLDFEYIIGQKIIRRGFNFLGIHYVIPGGFAVFRKKLLDTVGDYEHDTLAEDTDLSWRIMTETKACIHFDPSIEVIADEPSTMIGLWNQRIRWARGNIEVTWKNRYKVGKYRYGRGVTLAYPFWISSMLLPFAFICSSIGFITVKFTGDVFLSDISYDLGLILATFFYVSWIVGTLINKGKSWIGGLMTPGIPNLVNITAILFSNVEILGTFIPKIGPTFSIILGIWIFISIPGTYLCLYLARRGKTKIANMLQLAVFGYWMFLVVSILHASCVELMHREKTWTRTVR